MKALSAAGSAFVRKTRLCRFGRNGDDLCLHPSAISGWHTLTNRKGCGFRRFTTPFTSFRVCHPKQTNSASKSMLGLRKAWFCALAAFLVASGCMSPNKDKNTFSPTIIPMTANARSCEELRETMLKMCPVGTPSATTKSWLESEGFACEYKGGKGDVYINATRTDRVSFWTSRRWVVECKLDQIGVVEFTVTKGGIGL